MAMISRSLTALSLVAACALTASTGDTPVQAPLKFEPVIAPFPVSDSTGRLLEMAFLGGFNTPRPQLVDGDGDGDLDLFVQEITGQIGYFERDGERDGLPHFILRSEKYGGIDAGEWYRFADVDRDGDLDLLTEQQFSYIKFYRNDGSRGASQFVLAADTLRDAAGQALFADRQNIPQLGDIDCNGRADLLIGKVDGSVARYEAMAQSKANGSRGQVPQFEKLVEEFEGIKIVGEAQIGGDGQIIPSGAGPSVGGSVSMHGANTMALADYDNDSDLDLFWGDFFEPGLLLIQNTGSCKTFNYRNKPIRFPEAKPFETSGYNAPTFGDVNDDKRLDLVMGVLGGAFNPLRTSVENLYYVERTASGDWSVRSRQLLPVMDIGSETIPTIVDFDGDGDLDLLLANKLDANDLTVSRIYRYENIGTKTKPELRMRGALPFPGRDQFHAAPTFGDLDGDGKLDILLGGWKDRLAWYRATGSGYTMVDSAIITLTRGSNTVPTLGDLDGDGDLDLIVGEASGWLNYYRNDGTKSAPKFTLVSDEYDGIKLGRRSAPHLVDIDRDGDLDLLIGTESSGLALYRNNGSRTKIRFERDNTFAPPVPQLAAVASGDMDGDGDLDLIVGGAGGGAVYLEQR